MNEGKMLKELVLRDGDLVECVGLDYGQWFTVGRCYKINNNQIRDNDGNVWNKELVVAKFRIYSRAPGEDAANEYRSCLTCGRRRLASEPMDDLPDCRNPDYPGVAPCTWDATEREALEIWRARYHDMKAERDYYRGLVVYGFYEERYPLFHQGKGGESEITEPVTADQVRRWYEYSARWHYLNKLVDLIKGLGA